MRDHNESGDRDAALDAYRRCQAALVAATGSQPSRETDELAQLIREHGQSERQRPSQERNGARDDRRDRGRIRLGITPLRPIGTTMTETFALGLAEEITTALAKFRWISCVSAASWMALSGDPRPRGMWEELDLDFLLDGTVQQLGDRLRVTVRLMDMRAVGAVIWAGRFDREGTDLLLLQDELASAIVGQLDPALLMHEGERAIERNLADPSTSELLLQALPSLYRLERRKFHDARGLLEAAVAGDPGNALAHAWLAYWYLFSVGQGWATEPAEAASRGALLAEQAVTLDSTDARALTLAGHVRSFLSKRPAEGCSLHDRAIALNPNLALAWCFSGLAYSYLGMHGEALHRMYQAVRLSPSDPHLFFFDHALIMPHLLRSDFAAAAEIGRRAIELKPWFSSAYKGYLSALGHLGQELEAIHIRNRLLELEPEFTVEDAIARSPMTMPDDLAIYAEGLRRAGLPERRDKRPEIG
jgi:TolB-like protein